MGLFGWFSGKKNYDRAISIYDNLYEEYKSAQKKYEKDCEKQNSLLYEHINNINKHKEQIQTVLFRDLVEMLSLLKDVEIPEEFCEETYKRQCRKLDSFQKIKTRDSLLTIDFDGAKFKTTMQAIFTLGFHTRKKAKESLHNVENECEVLENEMNEMNSEIAKLKACVASAAQIEHYFDKMSSLFERWLRYMEHAVRYIGYAAMRMGKRITKRSISISLLHEKQQKELEATINLGKTLSKMIQVQIVMKKDENNLDAYQKDMKKCYSQYASVSFE